MGEDDVAIFATRSAFSGKCLSSSEAEKKSEFVTGGKW